MQDDSTPFYQDCWQPPLFCEGDGFGVGVSGDRQAMADDTVAADQHVGDSLGTLLGAVDDELRTRMVAQIDGHLSQQVGLVGRDSVGGGGKGDHRETF